MARRKHPRPLCTADERQTLYDLQDGKCAVCRRDDVDLHVDHSCRTGKTRGLLCITCNTELGQLGDSPRRLKAALQYLLRPPAQALS